MGFVEISGWIAVAGLVVGLFGIGLRLKTILNRPFKRDISRPRGSPMRGVLFAFTLGMAPWEKESTRIHWVAYLRGILFHIGVFAAIAVLLVSPWLGALPAWVRWAGAVVTGAGALFGYAGIVMRRAGENERALSLPDDYLSVFLSATFIALACGVLLASALLPWFYLLTALLAVYIPYSKIRHCVYFFYSKFFFGTNFGRRGVIGQAPGSYSE